MILKDRYNMGEIEILSEQSHIVLCRNEYTTSILNLPLRLPPYEANHARVAC